MALDWTLPRAVGTGLRFVRVDRTTRLELGELTTIETAGGRITRNLGTELKGEGSLSATAPPALGDDLVRIYYDVVDSAGATETVALATLCAQVASSLYTEATETATLTLYSALLALKQDGLATSLTLDATDVAIDEAVAICATAGLPTVASPSTKALTAQASWNAGTPKLTPVNWLCDVAGFWSVRPDNHGRALFLPYQTPSERAPVWEFASGENCIFEPSVTIASDGFNVPNVCTLTSSNLAAPISGTYTNDDPLSPYSTVTRGRTITLAKTVDDAVDVADLELRAQKDLIAATAATETIVVKHAYCPVTIGDVVTLVWPKHGLSMRASVESQSIELTPDCRTTSTMKRIWRA